VEARSSECYAGRDYTRLTETAAGSPVFKMKLRIIAGSLRGRNLVISGGASNMRPTGDRVREALGSYLVDRISGAAVADICAGSGAFGFEMISRGAARVLFAEPDRLRSGKIIDHAEKFNVSDSCLVRQQNAETFIQREAGKYDIIFYDPPYDNDSLAEAAPQLCGFLKPNGVLVYEFQRKRTLPTFPAVQIWSRIYGDTGIAVFGPGH